MGFMSGHLIIRVDQDNAVIDAPDDGFTLSLFRHDLLDIQIMESLQFLGHRVELLGEATEFVRGLDGNLHIIIAFGNFLGRLHHLLNRPYKKVGEKKTEPDPDPHRGNSNDAPWTRWPSGR